MGPFNGPLSSTFSMLYGLTGNRRFAKYAPLLKLPFASYYYSRISNPATFFNSRSSEVYSGEFARSLDKAFSIQPATACLDKAAKSGMLNQMLYVDTKTALPDDLLLKADKMTMANSIELRVPLLDHKLLEFAASLPESYKVNGFTTKYIAKRALQNRVPQEILDRKKVGFPVPYANWLRKDLKDWVQGILLDRETLSRGYFDRGGIENLIRMNSDSGEFSKEILSLVSLELWNRAFLTGGQAPVNQPVGPSSVAV
jgi:asparagine synthase (glutamine-hydrolysing)